MKLYHIGRTVIKVKRVIDMTHTLNEKVPTWEGSCGFSSKVIYEYTPGLVMEYHFSLSSAGTHMDSPSHFIRGGETIETISLEKLIVPLHLIDAAEEAGPDFFFLPRHIETYEKKYSRIEKNSFVVFYTGWEKFWNSREKYKCTGTDGNDHYPGVSLEVAQLLLERGIAGIGVDTLNPDGNDTNYPVHKIILGAGKYIVENLTNLAEVPPSGAFAAVLPIKIEKGCEAPIRAIAMTFD